RVRLRIGQAARPHQRAVRGLRLASGPQHAHRRRQRGTGRWFCGGLYKQRRSGRLACACHPRWRRSDTPGAVSVAQGVLQCLPMKYLRHFGHLIYRTYRSWSADGGSTLAASVAYYTALAFFPLLLILLSSFGYFLALTESGQAAEEQILDAIGDQLSPSLQEQVARALTEVKARASLGGPAGLVTLLVVVIALFSEVDTAFNRIWKIKADEGRGIWGTVVDVVYVRIKAFLMLLGLL